MEVSNNQTERHNGRSNFLGYTPLHLAAINKSQKVFIYTKALGNVNLNIASLQAFSTLMMDFKADRKIRDNSGKTATSYLKNVITSSVELKKGIAKNYVMKNGT